MTIKINFVSPAMGSTGGSINMFVTRHASSPFSLFLLLYNSLQLQLLRIKTYIYIYIYKILPKCFDLMQPTFPNPYIPQSTRAP